MMGFAEMFGLGSPDAADPADERRKRLLELLTQANQPEPIAELPVGRQQSTSGNLADAVLAGLADGFSSAAGQYGSNYSAVDALRRHREDRKSREDYNAQARVKNADGAKRGGVLADLEIMQQDAARLDKADERAYDATIKMADAAAKQQAAAAKRQQDIDDAASERRYNVRLAAAKSGAILPKDADEETMLNAIATQETKERNRKAAGKEDEPDYKKVGAGNTVAIQMLTGLPESEDGPATPPLAARLDAGETPEDLLDEFEMALDMQGIYGKERSMAMETYERRVGAEIRKWKKKKAEQNAANAEAAKAEMSAAQRGPGVAGAMSLIQGMRGR